MSGAWYVAACVFVPGLWGVAMYYVFEVIDRRRARRTERPRRPPVDYSI